MSGHRPLFSAAFLCYGKKDAIHPLPPNKKTLNKFVKSMFSETENTVRGQKSNADRGKGR